MHAVRADEVTDGSPAAALMLVIWLGRQESHCLEYTKYTTVLADVRNRNTDKNTDVFDSFTGSEPMRGLREADEHRANIVRQSERRNGFLYNEAYIGLNRLTLQ